MTSNLPPVVMYHADCTDGFGAAYAAWMHLGDYAEYRPVHYGDFVPLEMLTARQIFILDFSFSPDTVLGMSHVAAHITLLDHHKSAAEQWQGIIPASNAEITFDMNRSGAQMSWDYFHPGIPRPIFIDYIGDSDLWRFVLPDTKAFCAGLSVQPFTFESWQRITPEEVIENGRIILGHQQSQIDNAMSRELRSVTLAGHHGLAANVINNTSEIGHEIAKRSGTFSLTFFIKGDDVICSLRSMAPFDVSNIAVKYGGGGHAQASGFKMSIDRFFSEVWVSIET